MALIEKAALRLILGGAVGTGALLNLGKALQTFKPAIINVAKEGYAFKDWVSGRFESLKEDMEDITAESLHEYYAELETNSESLQREKKIWEQMELLIAEKQAARTAKEEGK